MLGGGGYCTEFVGVRRFPATEFARKVWVKSKDMRSGMAKVVCPPLRDAILGCVINYFGS